MTRSEYSQHELLTSVDVAGFSKIFSTMWGGSLYGRFEASAVFMVLLSLSNRDGIVDMTPEAIAGTTGWPLDFIKQGLSELASPDPRSRTPDEHGRRIVPLDEHREWGWRITNYQKYRDEMRSQERREYLREAKRRERASTRVNTSTNVNRVQPIADADADAEGREEKIGTRSARAHRLPEDFSLTKERRAVAEAEKLDPDRIFADFRDYWTAASGAKARKCDWDATWRVWCRNQFNRGNQNGTSGKRREPRPSAVERVRRATEKWLADGDEKSSGGVVIDG
jgi:hypothetical protein